MSVTNKEELIKIYNDTKSSIEDLYSIEGSKIKSSKNNVRTPDKNLLNSFPNKSNSNNIIVEPIDSVSALIKYYNLGKTCVLNMASSKRKGGGVENGSRAQEECLFRCSNLFMIPSSYYPLSQNEYIYSTDAIFIKDFNYGSISPVTCDVVTIPAINLNTNHIDNVSEGDDDFNYFNRMSSKIFEMLMISIENGCDNIILGAWGCGVFKNDPEQVSYIFKHIINKYEFNKKFKNIVFAVINDHNSVSNNYEIFKNQLS